MTRLGRFFGTAFGVAVLACLVLAGWALWSGGILDGPIARQVRAGSIYAEPGVGLDQAAAERIIGNRRLVVVFLNPGDDLRAGCDSVDQAADGTLVLMLSKKATEFDKYGCAKLPGVDDENFGKAFVAETKIATGVDQFVNQPLEALKVVAVNYDLLVRSGAVPDGARTVSPSLPRFLVAGAAVAAVIGGASGLYFSARGAGRAAAGRRRERDAATDDRSLLGAEAAVLAQQIIELDRRYARAGKPDAAHRRFDSRYRRIVADYTEVLTELEAAKSKDLGKLTERLRTLNRRCQALAESG